MTELYHLFLKMYFHVPNYSVTYQFPFIEQRV